MDELVFRFLIASQITSFSKEDVYLQLLSHADYPSVKAITDSLDYFGINNIAANVPKDALPQLPKSFLALLERDGSTELFLVTQSKKRVEVRTLENTKETLSLNEFSSQWTGTIIAIEQEEKKNAMSWKLSSVAPFIMIGVLFSLVLTSIVTAYTITHGLYLLLTGIGLFTGYLITKENVGLKDSMSTKVCNALSSKADSCTTVITSKEGELIKGFGLGDLSIIYFVSLILIIAFLGVQVSILFAVSIGTLFVVVYSIYLQGIQLKQWCGLCLLISVVLISQFVTLFVMFSDWDISLNYAFKAILISLITGIVLLNGKKLIIKNQELLKTKKDYFSFKRNKNFFIRALQSDTIKDLKSLPVEAQIYFGNPNAPIQITAYTNPLCGFCVAAFEFYDRLLNQYPKEIRIQMIFNTPNDFENPSTQIAKQIIEIYGKNPKDAFDAMRNWFSNRDVKKWQEIYGQGNSMLLMDDRILQMHRDIANQNNIYYTPETLIGNHKFPKKEYEYEDFLLFVDVLKEDIFMDENHQLEKYKTKELSGN